MAAVDSEMSLMREEINKLKTKLEDIERGVCFTSDISNVGHCEVTEADVDVSTERDCATRGSFCGFVTGLLSQSSLHGLPNITTSTQYWIKVFWTVLLIAGTGMAGWQTVEIFQEYVRYPVLTITNVYSHQTELPEVTVCNSNAYLKSSVLQEPRIVDKFEYGLSHYGVLMEASLLTEEERIQLSHNLSNFIRWRDSRHSRLSYVQVPRTQVGNCYSFVQTTYLKQYVKTNINLFVNLNVKEYVSDSIKHEGFALIREEGIYPHSYGEPFTMLEPGYRYIVYLRKENIIRLNGKYANCQDNEDTFYHETGMKYSQEACKAVCESKFILTKCGCISKFHYSFPGRYTISNTFVNISDCSQTNATCSIHSFDEIPCECKPRCHMKRYKISRIKKTKLTNVDSRCYDWYDCMIIANETDREDWVMNNIAQLVVRFADPVHTEYLQVPAYPLSQFLPDIGGTLGLYLGVSLLTLAEIPQLLIGTFVFYAKKNIRHRNSF